MQECHRVSKVLKEFPGLVPLLLAGGQLASQNLHAPKFENLKAGRACCTSLSRAPGHYHEGGYSFDEESLTHHVSCLQANRNLSKRLILYATVPFLHSDSRTEGPIHS